MPVDLKREKRLNRFPACLPVCLVLCLGPAACAGETKPSSTAEAQGQAETQERASAKSVSQTETKRREGSDWPVFLGPHGTGVSDETGLLKAWPKEGPPLLWEQEVGTGYSAPSVRGNRLVLHHRVDDEEIVECFRADDGTSLWKQSYASSFRDPYGYNNGPRCSPLLTEDRCYTFGAEGMLLCTDLKSGEKIWRRDTQKEFDVPKAFFGVGATPILEEGLLITLVGGQPNSGVVAFDAETGETGETVWENVGKKTWDGAQTGWDNEPTYEWTGEEMVVSYSSPFTATIHGKRHLLCLMRQGLVSLNPKDGSVRFRYWFRSRAHESVNAARPVVVDDKIFLSAAYRVGAAVLQVNEDGESYEELWRDHEAMLNHWSTSIYHEGYLYGFSGRHERGSSFRCIELDTGKVMWETDGFDGDLSDLAQDPQTGKIRNRETGETMPWPFYGRGSCILADGKLIVLGERGTLAMTRLNPKKFEEICRTSYDQIGYPSWAAPVLSRKRLYLRDEDSLICLDLAPSGSAKKN